MTVALSRGATVLFIGDSITDAGRDRANGADLGRGFVYVAAARFAAEHPEIGATFVNRGLSGDRVDTLFARWQADALELQPALITVMVGINNVVHRFKRDRITQVEEFEDDYRAIVHATRARCRATLIMMEPYLLPIPDHDRPEAAYQPVARRYGEWLADFEPKLAAIRRVAGEMAVPLVGLHDMFGEAATRAPATYWAYDGIHPTLAGQGLIAQAWREAVEAG